MSSEILKTNHAWLSCIKNITSFPLQVGERPELDESERNQGILVKTYGQAGDLDKVLAAWDEMEESFVHHGLTLNE